MTRSASHLQVIDRRLHELSGVRWYRRLGDEVRRGVGVAASALLAVALAIPVVLAGLVLVLRLATQAAGLVLMMVMPRWPGAASDE